jgi:arylsulfatase A-like enzyme
MPNLLFLMVDQQRYDCLGHTSSGLVSTPNLDALAGAGVRFTHAFSHMPVCCPARQSLLQGGRPESFGALWNYDIGLPVPTLDPAVRTWPAMLADRGYDAAYLGKWHVHPTATPLDFGYGEYVSLDDYSAERECEGLPDVDRVPWTGATDPAPLAAARTHWLASRAARWIGDHAGGGPWHLRLDFVEPHLPPCPVAEFGRRYEGRAIPPWGNFGDELEDKPYIQRQQLRNWDVEAWSWADWHHMVRRYLAVISQVDDAIGIVLDALERSGAAGDTLVIYTADHGDLAGAHGMMDKHYVMYDEVVRVPLLLRWPGRFGAGLVRDELVYNVLDLVPTICEAAGLPVPAECVGRSLVGLASGEPERNWRSSVAATYNGQQFGLFTQRMLRRHRWKYVWNATDVDELYDLEADPYELVNLAADPGRGGLIGELRAELWHVLSDEGDTQVTNEWLRRQFLGAWSGP